MEQHLVVPLDAPKADLSVATRADGSEQHWVVPLDAPKVGHSGW